VNKEVKQGIDTIIKFKPGSEPTIPTVSSIVPAFRDTMNFSFDIPIKLIHSNGYFSHFKKGPVTGTFNMSFKYTGKKELRAFEKDVSGQSVPSGYLELHFLGVDRTVESALAIKKAVGTSISYSNPTEDVGTATLDIIHGEIPTPLRASATKLI